MLNTNSHALYSVLSQIWVNKCGIIKMWVDFCLFNCAFLNSLMAAYATAGGGCQTKDPDFSLIFHNPLTSCYLLQWLWPLLYHLFGLRFSMWFTCEFFNHLNNTGYLSRADIPHGKNFVMHSDGLRSTFNFISRDIPSVPFSWILFPEMWLMYNLKSSFNTINLSLIIKSKSFSFDN